LFSLATAELIQKIKLEEGRHFWTLSSFLND
jgi:hypothetical protein